MILHRCTDVHTDAKGNTRLVILITISIDNEFKFSEASHRYESPSKYKKWLRKKLLEANCLMSDVIKEHKTTEMVSGKFQSFYTILKEGNFWRCLIVAKQLNSNCGYVARIPFTSMQEAMAQLGDLPPNHDFEVIADNEHQVYDMTEENMLIATIVFSSL